MSAPGAEGETATWEDRALERSLAAARDRSSARARRLVDAARRLATSGSATFTVADVAEDAGVSLRSFYRHFSGRDELLLALFEEEARTGAAMLREVVDAEPDVEPLERVRLCVDALCGLVTVGSDYASMLVREHLRLADQHPDEMRSALAPLLDVLAGELEAAADAGRLRPVDRFDAATVLALVLTHIQTAVLLAPDEPEPTERVWRFCRAALTPTEEER